MPMTTIFRFMALLSVIGLGTAVQADMVIESLDGPVTPNEIRAFKEHLRTVRIAKDNIGNAMVYGSSGNAVESLGDILQ